MFSLRSISLFALACTAIISAAPTVNVARQLPAIGAPAIGYSDALPALALAVAIPELAVAVAAVLPIPIPRGEPIVDSL